ISNRNANSDKRKDSNMPDIDAAKDPPPRLASGDAGAGAKNFY
ncbi:unnamed protein product, partial [marine sediment metagenome]